MAANDELDRLSLVLLERLTTEEARPPTAPSTSLVGGMAKSGADLERLLKAALVFAAAVERRQPEELLQSSGGRAPSFRKATLGQVAHALRTHFSVARAPAPLRPLIDDLRHPSSRTFAFINARNDIVKEAGDPKPGRIASRRLAELIAGFRRDAGWK